MVHLGEALSTQARGPKFNPQNPCTWQEGMTNLSVIPALKRQRQELSGASWLGREATSEIWWLTEDSASIYKGESGQKKASDVNLWSSHAHTCKHTYTQAYTHKNQIKASFQHRQFLPLYKTSFRALKTLLLMHGWGFFFFCFVCLFSSTHHCTPKQFGSSSEPTLSARVWHSILNASLLPIVSCY